MTDSTSHTPQPEGNLAAEFRKLGENLKEALQTAWESEDRRKLQQEIETGLRALGRALNDAATEFSESATGQRLKVESEELRERLRSGEMASRARDDLLALLRKINAELEKAGAGPSESEAARSTAGAENPTADVPSNRS